MDTKILIYIGYALLFINLLIYLKSYNNSTKAFKIVVWYLVYTSVLQLISHLHASHRMNNLYLSHYYFIGQFIFLSIFYYSILEEVILKTIIRYTLLSVVVILGIQFYVKPEIYFSFNFLEILLTFLPLVLYSLFYFHESFGVEDKKFLLLNSGMFFYLLGSVLIFSAGNLINSTNSPLNIIVWDINAFLYIVYQSLIFAEWYMNFRKSKISELNQDNKIL